jgi:hypothetical protein
LLKDLESEAREKGLNLAIESDKLELSVEFEWKSDGVYADVDIEEDGKKDTELSFLDDVLETVVGTILV